MVNQFRSSPLEKNLEDCTFDDDCTVVDDGMTPSGGGNPVTNRLLCPSTLVMISKASERSWIMVGLMTFFSC